MDMRVTPSVILSQLLAAAQQHTDLLAQLQQEASSGLRLQQPSDDPQAMVSLLASKAQDARLGTYLQNIQTAQSPLNASVSALQDVNSILSQAKQIAIQGSSSVRDSDNSFETLAQQVDNLLSRLVGDANSQSDGQYIFAGAAPNTIPFVVTNDSQGRPQSVVYHGSSQTATAPVSQQQSVNTLYPGSEVFQQRQRGATVFTGNTGAATGTGTDSAVGEGTLLVAHTSTSYASGSGVQPGTSSVAGDTILGPSGANTLTIVDTSGTGASGTISLNGGTPVAFTNGDTNLEVTGPQGAVAYVNTTAITPAFNGTVNITANGSLSVDGGASSVPINFSSNQVVTNSTTGAVTNVNSTNIRSTGADQVEYTGTFDAFQVLMALRDDLRNTQGLGSTQQIQSVSQLIGEVDRVSSSVSDILGQQSATLQNLSAVQGNLQQVQLDTKQRESNLGDADITSVVVGIQQQQQLLQLTFDVTARSFDQSLLNFLSGH
jgi:flagellar hook-associated protein 3